MKLSNFGSCYQAEQACPPHYDIRATSMAAMATTPTRTPTLPLAEAPGALQVSGSEAVQMVAFAHVLPAAHEEPDLRGLTIALNCCFTAAGQPEHAVFKHDKRVSIGVQL